MAINRKIAPLGIIPASLSDEVINAIQSGS